MLSCDNLDCLKISLFYFNKLYIIRIKLPRLGANGYGMHIYNWNTNVYNEVHTHGPIQTWRCPVIDMIKR